MTRNLTRRRFTTVVGLGLASSVALVACGGSDGAAQPVAQPAPVEPGSSPVTLEISSVGDDSRFDKETLEAPAGSAITLVFTNASRPEANKKFNWVLTRPGTQLKVVNSGLTEGEANDYVKPNDESVIAHTRLIGGGESDTITFAAPPPGDYPYICTFPGYYTRMRGVLTIK